MILSRRPLAFSLRLQIKSLKIGEDVHAVAGAAAAASTDTISNRPRSLARLGWMVLVKRRRRRRLPRRGMAERPRRLLRRSRSRSFSLSLS